jgi:hypothetical protein
MARTRAVLPMTISLKGRRVSSISPIFFMVSLSFGGQMMAPGMTILSSVLQEAGPRPFYQKRG